MNLFINEIKVWERGSYSDCTETVDLLCKNLIGVKGNKSTPLSKKFHWLCEIIRKLICD